jgi:hypothetical protein
VNAATSLLLVVALQERAWPASSFVLRIDPDPVRRTHKIQQIIAAESPPSFQVRLGGMQITAEELTTKTAGQTSFWLRTNLPPPSAQPIEHFFLSSPWVRYSPWAGGSRAIP